MSVLYTLFLRRDHISAFLSANLPLLFLGVGLEGLNSAAVAFSPLKCNDLNSGLFLDAEGQRL